MRKLLILSIILVSILTPVFAVNYGDVEAADFSTKAGKTIAKYFEDNKIDTWLYKSSTDKDMIIIEVKVKEEVRDLRIFIDDDGKSASLIMWDLIEFDEEDFEDMVMITNQINSEFRWMTFYCESDNTVTISTDCFFPSTGNSTVISVLEEYIKWIELSAADAYEMYQY